eukprot:Gb_38021 [translate_table: standard]
MLFLQLVSELPVEDLGELVYAWELPGVAGNAWNGEPGRSTTIGSSCIWDKFIFLATERPGDCMVKLLECLINPGYRLGIITGCSRGFMNGSHGLCLEKRLRFWQPCMTVDRRRPIGSNENRYGDSEMTIGNIITGIAETG